MAKVMKLTFKFDGTVEKETSGFTGQSCAKETEWVEKTLGKVQDRKWKAEAGNAGYLTTDPQKQQQQGY